MGARLLLALLTVRSLDRRENVSLPRIFDPFPDLAFPEFKGFIITGRIEEHILVAKARSQHVYNKRQYFALAFRGLFPRWPRQWVPNTQNRTQTAFAALPEQGGVS